VLFAGLSIALLSGAAWIVLLAAELNDGSWTEALADRITWTLLTETRFGTVSQLRMLSALALAALVLAPARGRIASTGCRTGAGLAATFFAASLAWIGHAGAATGATGALHLSADAVHILAASAWIGGLLPLLLTLADARRREGSGAETCQILRRFSDVGMVAVGALLLTGIVSAYFLTDRLRGLFGTDYGALLLIKMALFAGLLGVAAANRMLLLPRMSRSGDSAASAAFQRIHRNVAIEIAIGAAVVTIAAVLGMIPPAGHSH
jgi:putative copper resistance protein D